MKFNYLYSIFVVILLSTGFKTKDENKGKLIIEISNLQNSKGIVGVSIFNNSEAYPTKPDQAVRNVAVPISNNKAIVIFEDLPNGEYAFAFLHDENKNGKMDFNIVGIPKEGYGASNDAKANFGPPTYKDAKFTFAGKEMTIKVNTRYFL